MEGRRLSDSMGLSKRSRFIGELIVAILEVKGPLKAGQLLEEISEVEKMRRFSVRSIGSIASRMPGVVKISPPPKAEYDILEGTKPDLPQTALNRIRQKYSIPYGDRGPNEQN